MTGFDETVPPDDITDDQDVTAADNATDNLVKPEVDPERTDADERPA